LSRPPSGRGHWVLALLTEVVFVGFYIIFCSRLGFPRGTLPQSHPAPFYYLLPRSFLTQFCPKRGFFESVFFSRGSPSAFSFFPHTVGMYSVAFSGTEMGHCLWLNSFLLEAFFFLFETFFLLFPYFPPFYLLQLNLLSLFTPFYYLHC